MLDFIQEQFVFFLAFFGTLFLPGWIIFALPKIKKHFSFLERSVFSLATSIIIIDILLLLLNALEIKINRANLLVSIFLFFIAILFFFFPSKQSKDKKNNSENYEENQEPRWNKKEFALLVLFVAATFGIKTLYLANTVFPTTTDLGHHMYWAKSIAVNGEIPAYEEQEIIQARENYSISQPEKIADFIVGEHLIFTAIAILSDMEFMSAFPIIILYAVNMSGILASLILALQFFKNHPLQKKIALLTFFLLGPLYTISSAQAKFVSGGVVGNLIGNLFLPIALYFLFRALNEKKPFSLWLGSLFIFGLFYTHHLTSFVFIFILIFSIAIFTLLNFRQIHSHSRQWLKLTFSPQIIGIFIFYLFFIFFVHTPSYLNPTAIDTAVGTPIKATRVGLSLSELAQAVGNTRLSLGIFGLLIIFFSSKELSSYARAVLSGWLLAILTISLHPDWLFIDIPSNRIANYITYPSAIAGALALAWFIAKTKERNLPTSKIIFTLLFLALITGGFYDNAISLKTDHAAQKARDTIAASDYLAKKITEKDAVLKDHNFLTADSWIKLAFMRDYNFPFSRSYFKRYEDPTNPREMCTLWMISAPTSPQAEICYAGTGINYLMINPAYDNEQFIKNKNFNLIYSGNNISIFKRKH